jgi:hypothetical protein
MNKIQSFANAKEYQELFGYVEHGNGVKSRRNKILLALLKSKTVWAYCKEHDDWSLLAIKSMAELKTKLTKMISDAGVHQGLENALDLNGVIYHSDIYETDSYRGIPEDGSIGFVRYINHSNNSGVFKMRAGRFYSKLIDETNIGQALPQQVKTWLCEEFSQDWQVYIAGTLPNFTLIVDHDFAEIYSGEACSSGFNSCMIDRGFHSFYRDSVKAKAARLVDEDGIILARCVIFTEVLDEEDKVWRLAERQYAKDQSDILKRALVDALIKAGEIDGYKQVGCDCGSSRSFCDLEGNSLSQKKFRIECNLDWEDKLSYQDSFKYYNLDRNVAYNYTDVDYSYNLDTTNGQLEDDEEMFYAEYQDRDAYEVTDVFYHGSEITCDSDDLSDFIYWSDNYYHEDDLSECPECSNRMLSEEYYREELFYSELTEEYYCCQKCRENAELQFKKDNWHYCDFDQKYYEQDDILTTYNAWNEELGMYETKTVNIEMVEVYINCEILFRIGDELYDEINEQTELPLDVEVEDEALIEA